MSEIRHDGFADHDGRYYHNGDTFFKMREYEYQFDLPEMRLRNASIHIRPDAVSSDYLTSFTVGPVAQGDVSGGILNRLWRVRVGKDHRVWVSRADNSFTGE